MDQQKTGQYLKKLRNEKKLTQEQLAEKFNVSSRSVSRWETGRNLPDISLLVEIADFYEVDVREIIDGEAMPREEEKMQEVAEKMADYAKQEKSRLLKFIQVISFAGVIIGIVAIVLQMLTYEPDLRKSGAILLTLIITGVMAVISLYVAGILQKIVRNRKLFTTIKVVTIVLTGLATTYALLGILTIGIFYLMGAAAKVEVSNDISGYQTIFNSPGSEKYGVLSTGRFDIFPGQITGDMQVKDYQYMYYNPFDAQHIAYLTVKYNEEDYRNETDRLRQIGVEDFIGIYSVSAEPDGYDLLAMDLDEYSGFVYAMIPEGANAEHEITYVGIEFCNYSLDVDIHQYLPDEYLLKDFDASDNNLYRQKMLP